MPQTTAATPVSPPPQRTVRTPPTNDITELFPLQGEWMEEDYFDLPESTRIIELSEGRLVLPEMPKYSHQYAVGELFARLREFVQQQNLGVVALAPLSVRLWPDKIRQPDIVFMHRDHADRIGEDYWGVPDLVVEVISPRTPQSSGTEHTDRQEKFWEYAQAEVAEYWLVHPLDRTIEVFVLRDREFHLLGQWNAEDTARSEVLAGLEIAVQEVFAP